LNAFICKYILNYTSYITALWCTYMEGKLKKIDEAQTVYDSDELQ